MQPKKSFTHFFKIQKTSEVPDRKTGLIINNNNAGIIYDNFEESFYGVQSKDKGYGGTAPEKVIIARNKKETPSYQITKKYVNEEDWSSLPKVYGAHNSEGYCKTNNSVIIPLDSKLVNGEKITDRIKNNMLKQPGRISNDFKTYMNHHRIPKDRLEYLASSIGAIE